MFTDLGLALIGMVDNGVTCPVGEDEATPLDAGDVALALDRFGSALHIDGRRFKHLQ